MVDDEETTFEMSQQTVLDAALKQGIDVPAKRICSSCLARVTLEQLRCLKFYPY
jgi:ring-1,2-phenylacetyl-CoA epoxidase subunit PaaE